MGGICTSLYLTQVFLMGAMHWPGLSPYVFPSAMADSTCSDVCKTLAAWVEHLFFSRRQTILNISRFPGCTHACVEGVKLSTWKLPFGYMGWMKPWTSLSWNASTEDKGGHDCARAMVTAIASGIVNLTGLKAWWAWGILLLLSVLLTDGGGTVAWVYAWTACKNWYLV